MTAAFCRYVKAKNSGSSARNVGLFFCFYQSLYHHQDLGYLEELLHIRVVTRPQESQEVTKQKKTKTFLNI